MSKKNKKRKDTDVRSQPSSSERKITEVELPKGISFSFRYYQDDNEKFSIRERDARYLESLLARLRDLSTLTAKEIVNNRSQSLRCHAIIWSDTTEPNGFGIPNEDQLVSTGVVKSSR